MLLRLTCKQATALLISRQDRELLPLDRLVLRMHVTACRACPVVERQLLTMRNAFRQWRNYSATRAD